MNTKPYLCFKKCAVKTTKMSRIAEQSRSLRERELS